MANVGLVLTIDISVPQDLPELYAIKAAVYETRLYYVWLLLLNIGKLPRSYFICFRWKHFAEVYRGMMRKRNTRSIPQSCIPVRTATYAHFLQLRSVYSSWGVLLCGCLPGREGVRKDTSYMELYYIICSDRRSIQVCNTGLWKYSTTS